MKVVLIYVRKNGPGICGVSGPVEDRNCLRELVVGTSLSLSLSLSKLLLSLLSETSERASAYYSHKISSSCRTFLRKTMTATAGKHKECLNEWSLCFSLLVLQTGGQDRSVCLFVTWDLTSCIKLSVTLRREVRQTSWHNACAGRRVKEKKKLMTVNNACESNHEFPCGLTAIHSLRWTLCGS
jgi:hypothetical protein